jgi:hypothetical protein
MVSVLTVMKYLKFLKMRPKVAFYPCCQYDINEPLALLHPYVEKVIFCDINHRLLTKWEEIVDANTNNNRPSVSFLVGDVRKVISSVEVIDVLFYRGDSQCEGGGSGIFVLGDSFLPYILKRYPPEGGLIITDGSNSRGGNFKKMTRPNGMKKHGWAFKRTPDQPYIDEYRLQLITVKPDL